MTIVMCFKQKLQQNLFRIHVCSFVPLVSGSRITFYMLAIYWDHVFGSYIWKLLFACREFHRIKQKTKASPWPTNCNLSPALTFVFEARCFMSSKRQALVCHPIKHEMLKTNVWRKPTHCNLSFALISVSEARCFMCSKRQASVCNGIKYTMQSRPTAIWVLHCF